MERLIKELVQIEKKRNSLLAEISNSLKEIANRENGFEMFNEIMSEAKQYSDEIGKSAF